MAGFSVGIGVGIRYDTPIEKRLSGEMLPDILDALLMEDGTLLLMEDGTYFQLENDTPKASKSKDANKINVENYWNLI